MSKIRKPIHSPTHTDDNEARAGPPGVIGTAEIIRLKVDAVATSPSRSTRLSMKERDVLKAFESI